MQQNLPLKVRYFQDSTPPDVPCREENFIRREIEMPLPVAQTALVLVDLWNVHHIDSWIERAQRVTLNAIMLAIEAARHAGLTIVHAPSPLIAGPVVPLKLAQPSPPSDQVHPPAHKSQWPPNGFRGRQGEYSAYRGPRDQPPGVSPRWEKVASHLSISPDIEVQDDDYVIATGEQLHDLCRERSLLHLLYAGFATNWCILNRDYGMRAFANLGYNVILLRDATTGVEYPDTLNKLWVTEMAIREVENQLGFSASNEDLVAACAAVSDL